MVESEVFDKMFKDRLSEVLAIYGVSTIDELVAKSMAKGIKKGRSELAREMRQQLGRRTCSNDIKIEYVRRLCLSENT